MSEVSATNKPEVTIQVDSGFYCGGKLGCFLHFAARRGLLRLLLRGELLFHLECYGVGVHFINCGGIAENSGGIGTSRRQENG